MRIQVCALVLAVAASLPTGAVKYVDKNNPGCNDLGPGTAPVPYCTIQRGYNQAANGEQVRVLPGTYNECLHAYSLFAPKSVDIVADAWLQVHPSNTVTILDAGAAPNCSFPGGGPAAGVNIAGYLPTGSSFRGFTVRNGSYGGGILAVGSVAITNNVLTGNGSLGWGGGIYLYTANCYYGDSVSTIADNQVRNNFAEDGGGGIAVTAGYQDIVQSPDCTLDGDSLVTVQGNVLTDNRTRGSGGGINFTTFTNNVRESRIVITQNLITGNSGGMDSTFGYGGGIYGLLYGYGTEILDVTHNTVVGNQTEDRGGGISVVSFPAVVATTVNHRVRVDDNTVTTNVGERGGGGIDLLGHALSFAATQTIDISARNNTVTGNQVTRDTALSAPFKGGGGISALFETIRSTSPNLRMTIENNSIRSNVSKVYGGGVSLHAKAGSPTLTGASSANVRLAGNLVADNRAESQIYPASGGGVFAYLEAASGSTASIDMALNTVARNALDNVTEVGGIHAESFTRPATFGLSAGRAAIALSSSIVSHNDGVGYGGPLPGTSGLVTPGGTGNLDASALHYNDVFGNDVAYDGWLVPGIGNIAADPRYVSLGTGDFHLAASSPAIDAGDPAIASPPLLDLDGDARIIDGDGEGTERVDMGYDEALQRPVVFAIDVKPGTTPNVVNLYALGVLPVAILGSAGFDVTSIDVTTVRFGPAAAAPAHDLLDPETYLDHLQDVDADGFLDLMTHFRIQALGLNCDMTEVELSATTTAGLELRATDSIAPKCGPAGRRTQLKAVESPRPKHAEGTTVDIAPN